MKLKLTQSSLIKSIEKRALCIEDPRAANHHYDFKDIIMGCFWMCFLNSSSMRSYYEDIQKARSNLSKLCAIKELPCRNQLCNVLDLVAPEDIKGVFDDIIAKMNRSGVLKDFKDPRFGYLVAIDGTQIVNSENIHCEKCCQKHHRDGRIEYHHGALNVMLIHPEQDIALPIDVEFIQRQDGIKKEDCERNAAKRWLNDFPKRHKIIGMTILGDDLHCNQPFIESLESKGYHYITTCKEGSHKYLYDWISTLREGKDLKTVCVRKYRNGRHQIDKYEYANGVEIREQDAVRGNFAKLTIEDLATGKQKTFAYLTNYKIRAKNVEALVEAARRRWKVENEGHNVLKTQGYNFDTNYGHGKENLCQLIATMKLLSLSMHVLIDYVKQEGLAKVRKSYSSIKKAMEIIRTIFWMKSCKNWEELYGYAIRGIDSS